MSELDFLTPEERAMIEADTKNPTININTKYTNDQVVDFIKGPKLNIEEETKNKFGELLNKRYILIHDATNTLIRGTDYKSDSKSAVFTIKGCDCIKLTITFEASAYKNVPVKPSADIKLGLDVYNGSRFNLEIDLLASVKFQSNKILREITNALIDFDYDTIADIGMIKLFISLAASLHRIEFGSRSQKSTIDPYVKKTLTNMKIFGPGPKTAPKLYTKPILDESFIHFGSVIVPEQVSMKVPNPFIVPNPVIETEDEIATRLRKINIGSIPRLGDVPKTVNDIVDYDYIGYE